MPGYIRVTAPEAREVYVNGGYTALTPPVSPHTITVEFGPNTFEMLTADKKVDFRKTETVDQANPYKVIALDPVVPPEPTLLTPPPPPPPPDPT